MKKLLLTVGAVGLFTLTGCSTIYGTESSEHSSTETVSTSGDIVQGSLAQARLGHDGLFACFYEVNGKMSSAYPKRMQTCPGRIIINRTTNDISFAK